MEQPVLNQHNKEEYPPMHTCEHIVNGTMVKMFGCGRAVSAHIEKKKSKLDFRLEAEPEQEQIDELEKRVNEVIASDLPVTMSFITQEEAASRFDLKRLPDEASDTVRVVSIGDYDDCLCIGKHVGHTSEIGSFKIISHNFENGILRIRFKLI